MKMVIFVYLGLTLLSLLWSAWTYGKPLQAWSESRWPSLLGLTGGAFLVVFYVFLSQIFVHLFEWARQLEKILSHLLTPLSYFQILVISSLSGFVEEWFFRGVLYPHFGIIMSSLIFAACHLLPAPKLWIWSVWTFFAGIIFCLILKVSDSLWLCALIHSAINAVGLILLNRKAYAQPSFRSLS